MNKVEQFRGKTPEKKDVLATFAPIENEILELTQATAVLEARKTDAETFRAVVGVEEDSRIAKYQEALVEQNTEVSKAIPVELKQIKEKTFESENEIAGLDAAIATKKERLAVLREKLKEKNYLLSRIDLFSAYDKFNEMAAAFAPVIQGVFEAHQKCYNVAYENRTAFLEHIRLDDLPRRLPIIFVELNVVNEHPEYELDFWNMQRYLDNKRAARGRG